MIRYALSCAEGHDFEAWFGSSEAFDRQAEARSIACPVCGSAGITKAPMAPHVARRAPEASAQPEPRKSYAMLRKLRAELTANSDYVGPKFPEEARKIHYDEAEARNIHGEATGEEARDLAAEGIPVFPLPRLPEDQN
jgi:hypothetical protein